MADSKSIFTNDLNKTIAIYGLGTETERFLNWCGAKLNIVGLLDSFRTEGEIYGYPIISTDDALRARVEEIIVVARPGSCKAIAKRIGDFCRDNGIFLFDVRGRDLLNATVTTFCFRGDNSFSKTELLKKIEDADVVSFDLFDTLVMRKVSSYTDVFELMDYRLSNQEINIPNFVDERLGAEKELSKHAAPKLEMIYDSVLEKGDLNCVSSFDLAQMEWELDNSLLVVREAVAEVYRHALAIGKKVVITTDTYYSKEQIAQILERFKLAGYDRLIVSCEYNKSKSQGLFDVLTEKYPSMKMIHVGDDEYTDVENAKCSGINTFRLRSASELCDILGGLDVEKEVFGISDKVKFGMFLSVLFNNPFWFEAEENRLSVGNAKELGYLFCAPMITDFVMWLRARLNTERYGQILFGARDGYLVEQLYRMVDETIKSYYFVTSRTAAIRAGVENSDDIDYVASMKYFGTAEEELKTRYGIEVDNVDSVEKNALILDKARKQRENYRKYIKELEVGDGELAIFDFVAKGTSQMFLQRLFAQRMKGFYFMQLEPEFMKDKGLEIESFYSDEERDSSSIFENYYILETILTAPYPQMVEMDDDGNPVYMKETRSARDISCFGRAQEGIREYFKDYIEIVPQVIRKENKNLDEALLSLINKVLILDEDFIQLKVEDPFFGRETDMKDVIGG